MTNLVGPPEARTKAFQDRIARVPTLQQAERALGLRPLFIVTADPTVPWVDLAELVSALAVPPGGAVRDCG